MLHVTPPATGKLESTRANQNWLNVAYSPQFASRTHTPNPRATFYSLGKLGRNSLSLSNDPSRNGRSRSNPQHTRRHTSHTTSKITKMVSQRPPPVAYLEMGVALGIACTALPSNVRHRFAKARPPPLVVDAHASIPPPPLGGICTGDIADLRCSRRERSRPSRSGARTRMI